MLLKLIKQNAKNVSLLNPGSVKATDDEKEKRRKRVANRKEKVGKSILSNFCIQSSSKRRPLLHMCCL